MEALNRQNEALSTGSRASAAIINPAVRLEREGLVGSIVLTRPEQINAINDDVRRGVPAALEALNSESDIRVIIIRGEGPRGFCAGADIKERREPEDAVQVHRRMQGLRWVEALDRVQKPVIAAVHGYCMGGGMELALACDIRYLAPGAILALPETALGLIPGGGGTQRLPRMVGLACALDLLITGERISAQRAIDLGIATRLAVSDASLHDEVMALARLIANRSPAATAFVKRAARASLEMDLARGLDLELDLFALLVPMADVKEAAQAFREKRTPQFNGR